MNLLSSLRRLGIRRLTLIGLVAMVLSIAWVAPTAQKKESAPAPSKADEEFYRFIDVASEVYRDIQTDYVDEVPSRKILEGALKGMIQTLDEHSQYLDPDTLEQLEKDTEGEFSGIGIHITLRQGVLTVIAPIPGSPAARVGLQPWDRIIEIEGESTEGIILQDAVKKLTGPPGTKVTIKIYREGELEPLTYTIKRQTIKVDSVHARMFENGIGYIRLAKFSGETSVDMRKALSDLKEKGLKALILDLRFNTGGLLREAIEVSELFVPKGEIVVSTKGRLSSQNREYMSKKDPVVNVPVFVLINEGTASASEIVAGAIQDHHLGVVIGPEVNGTVKNSFGKGSVQTIGELKHSFELDKDGNPLPNALRLTTAKYYTPRGRSIHHKGIQPDVAIAVPRTFQSDLIRHGLIGDPSQIEPGKEAVTEEPTPTETKAPETDATPEGGVIIPERREENPDVTPTPNPNFYLETPDKTKKKPAATKDPGTFRDLMLDEAVRQMKVYLILQQAQDHREGERVASTTRSEAGKTASAPREVAPSPE